MNHQILIEPQHRTFQCIVWRFSYSISISIKDRHLWCFFCPVFVSVLSNNWPWIKVLPIYYLLKCCRKIFMLLTGTDTLFLRQQLVTLLESGSFVGSEGILTVGIPLSAIEWLKFRKQYLILTGIMLSLLTIQPITHLEVCVLVICVPILCSGQVHLGCPSP